MNHLSDDAPDPSAGAMGFPIDVSIPSDLRLIERVVDLVSRHVAELPLPLRVRKMSLPVALTEAISNAILYGNLQDLSKTVRVRAALENGDLVLEVSDQGTGFDLEACTRDPTRPENLDREDGRGLFLMRSLMDRVERYSDGGNVVRLTVHRT
jgi:serine/threonine-protein kinase RsbW